MDTPSAQAKIARMPPCRPPGILFLVRTAEKLKGTSALDIGWGGLWLISTRLFSCRLRLILSIGMAGNKIFQVS